MNKLTASLPKFQSSRWLWIWPRVALVLFVAAVAALLWYSWADERDEQRAVLISDVLWVEQNLRFQLEQTQERLRALLQADHDTQLDEHTLYSRAGLLLDSNHETVGVALLRADRSARVTIGQQVPDSAAINDALKIAYATHLAAYSDPFLLDGDWVIAQVLPHGLQTGIVLISLTRLINQDVPWWFATKYRLLLQDREGLQLASKSNIDTVTPAISYQLPFDPPGHGLILNVTAYRVNSSLIRNLLVVSVIVLALAVLWSLFRLRRHVQGRIYAEAALRQEHAFRKAMEDSLLVGMRARDMAGRIIYVNAAFCRMVGFAAEELIGTSPPHPYWHPDTMDQHQRQSEAVLAGLAPVEGFESRIQDRAGNIVETKVYTAPLIDANGQQRGWMSSIVDITSQKQAEAFARQQEEKLQQTARLVSMGEMASTLAHELNQPLMAMSSYAGAAKLLSASGQAELVTATLEKIAQQAERAAQIVRRIRDFVRRRSPHFEHCDMNEVVENAVGLNDADARHRELRIETRLADDLPVVIGDRILLEQVLLNLVRNAMDASISQPPERRSILVSTVVEGDSLCVSVADQGLGLEPEVAARLFEAFYTTKQTGMGMGLSICRSIIENHHGKLWFTRREGGGVIFQFSLPVDGSAEPPDATQPQNEEME